MSFGCGLPVANIIQVHNAHSRLNPLSLMLKYFSCTIFITRYFRSATLAAEKKNPYFGRWARQPERKNLLSRVSFRRVLNKLKKFRTAFPTFRYLKLVVDLGDHVNMKVGGLMRKQRNVPGRIFDFPYLVSLQGKRLAWALEVDQRINTNGLPLKRYVLTLTFFF